MCVSTSMCIISLQHLILFKFGGLYGTQLSQNCWGNNNYFKFFQCARWVSRLLNNFPYLGQLCFFDLGLLVPNGFASCGSMGEATQSFTWLSQNGQGLRLVVGGFIVYSLVLQYDHNIG